ncbi:MAG: 50S ribosomal protein L23 [Patescibacteria group bacterium]
MTLKPRMSEKAYGLSQSSATYVFEVPADANKLTVASAVSKQFKVKVKSVNIANIKGKPKRSVRRGGRVSQGSRSDSKHAYVTLMPDNEIPVFAVEEEKAEKAAKLQENLAKRSAKAAKKESK